MAVTPRALRRTGTILILVIVALFYLRLDQDRSYNRRVYRISNTDQKTNSARQKAIKDAFRHAWSGYTTHCWGYDTLRPVTNECKNDFGGFGAQALDALPTAIMFELEDVTLQILDFVAGLDFTQVKGGKSIFVFETVIRHFAALISSWDLLSGPFSHVARNATLRSSLYAQMVNLGDILACAFQTKSGIPAEWVDAATCRIDAGTLNTVAGAGTTILEFARLSDITKDKKYVKLARKAQEYLLRPNHIGEPYPGLLGSHVSLAQGTIVDSSGSWGAFADSFYEYLLKAYLYDSRVYGVYLERWLLAADSTMRYIASHPYGHPEWTLLPSWSGENLYKRMETLSWFAGGNIILGGMTTDNQTLVDFGLSIADTAGAVYHMTTTGLGPEFVSWSETCASFESSDDKSCADEPLVASDPSFRLRPEIIETWYYAYRATRDPKYREWTWKAFVAINKYCKTDSGFSTISNVERPDGGTKTDIQESFVLAEVLKYTYLIHLEDLNNLFHVQDSRTGVKNTWIYNTEAHPFRVEGPPQ